MTEFSFYQTEYEGAYWEVVLYQRVRILQHYTKGFKKLDDALAFAQLMLANPNLSQVVVHSVVGKCPA